MRSWKMILNAAASLGAAVLIARALPGVEAAEIYPEHAEYACVSSIPEGYGREEDHLTGDEGTGALYDTADEEFTGEIRAFVIMGGQEASDGRYYYRGDNCGIRVIFTDTSGEEVRGNFSCMIDGDPSTSKEAVDDGSGFPAVEYSAEEVSCALADGEHTIYIEGFDEKGRTCEISYAASCGVYPLSGGAAFVLDRRAPRASLAFESPGAANRAAQEPGGRHYLNADAVVRIEIDEPLYSGGDIRVYLGRNTAPVYESSTCDVGEYILCEASEMGPSGAVFEETLSEEGVYRFLVSGCDAAGNPVEMGEGFDPEGRSRFFVIDKTAPEGEIEVCSEQGLMGRMRDGGIVEYAAPFTLSGSSKVEVMAGDERSPVSVSALIRDAKSGLGEEFGSGGFVQRGFARTEVFGDRSFGIEGAVISDMAGNRTELPCFGTFYIDGSDPRIEPLVPEEACGGGRYYNSSVTIPVVVSDDEAGGGSGLMEVIAGIYGSGGGLLREEVLFRSSGGIYETAWDGDERCYTYESSFTVPGSYSMDDMKVRITARDMSGRTAEEELSLSVDTEPPLIRISFETDGSGSDSGMKADSGVTFFKSPVEAHISVNERHFDPHLIEIEAGEASLGAWERRDTGEWVRRARFEEDGAHSIHVSGFDAAMNRAVVSYEGGASERFVIDTTPPVIALSFADSDYEPGVVVGTRDSFIVKVSDEHFGGDHDIRFKWDGEFIGDGGDEKDPGSGDGGPMPAFAEGELRLDFDMDGRYLAEGTVSDLAGNLAQIPDGTEWTLDTVPPEIVINGAEDGVSYRSPPEIEAAVKDANLISGSVRASIVGERQGILGDAVSDRGDGESGVQSAAGRGDGESGAQSPGGTGDVPESHFRIELPQEDDNYILKVSAADGAGAVTKAEMRFTVNTSGPTLTPVSPSPEVSCVTSAVSPEILVEDIDPVSIVSALVNGAPAPARIADNRVVFDELREDGKYIIDLKVRDSSGYTADLEPMEFEIDTVPPSARVEPEAGRKLIYKGEMAFAIMCDDPGAELWQLLLDGRDVRAAAARGTGGRLRLNFGEGEIGAGRHSLSAVFIDKAGNEGAAEEFSFIYGGRYFYAAAAPLVLGLAALCLLVIRMKRGRGRKAS